MEPPASPGRIILLNGVSSAGKTTLARQLLTDLASPYFHMSVDMFGAMRAEAATHALDDAAQQTVLRRTRAGFHRAVAGMARAGNDIVMDHVLSEPWRLRDCLDVLTGLDVLFVGVHCAPDELRRRETTRGDREPGTAERQLGLVHAHGGYDLEIDTAAAPPEACSARIVEFIDRTAPPRTFDRLRAAI